MMAPRSSLRALHLPPLSCLLLAVLSPPSALADLSCAELDAKVDTSEPTRAVVSIATSESYPRSMLEYYAGKFPTQLRTPDVSNGRAVYEMSNLDPGVSYDVKVFSCGPDPEPCPTGAPCLLTVTTPGAKETSCDLMQGMDFTGNDLVMPYSEGMDFAGSYASSAEECCKDCAALKPYRPYVDRCDRFVFEESSGKCYYKQEGAESGKVEREGYVAGKVTLKA